MEMFGFCSRMPPLWISLLLSESRMLEPCKLLKQGIEIVLGPGTESIRVQQVGVGHDRGASFADRTMRDESIAADPASAGELA